MSECSARPDLSSLEIPMDAWTQPFWEATEKGELLLPQCGSCGRFRWPPGPFCPACQSQSTIWLPAGPGYVFSFTILSGPDNKQAVVPALIEFPEAGDIRLLASLADTPLDSIRIGAKVGLTWSPAANANVPMFQIVPDQAISNIL